MIALLVGTAASGGATGYQAPSPPGEPTCASVFRDALHAAARVPEAGRLDLDPEVRRSMALFRLHRRREALTTLTYVQTLLRGQPGQGLSEEVRSPLIVAVGRLKDCLTRSTPAPLATLTVRVFMGGPAAPDYRGPPARAGTLVVVDDIIVGRTGSDGTLKLRVPSGTIELRAEIHAESGYYGEATVDLPPRGSGEAAIVLGEGAHPAYRTPVVLVEAARETISVASRSMTLQFLENGRTVPIDRVIDVELLDTDFREQLKITDQFRTERGRIIASDPAALLALLPKNEWIFFNVTGRDTAGVHRNGVVRLRISS